MRMIIIGLAVAALALLAGCGGGGTTLSQQPQITLKNKLEISYLNSIFSAPQSQGSTNYHVSANLWMSRDDALLADLHMATPFELSPLVLGGPSVVPPDDGADKDTVPTLLYWGQGETIPAKQPQRVNPGDWMPGYEQPEKDLYLYAGGKDLNALVAIAGAYQLANGANTTSTWSVPPAWGMLGTTTFSSPINIIVNNAKPLVVTWRPVQGAAGYLVNINGDVKDNNSNTLGHIVWTSTNQPIMFDAIHDYTPYLLPASTTSVTVPAYTFTGCQAITINVLAHAAPYTDTTTSPAFRLVSASLTSEVYVMYSP